MTTTDGPLTGPQGAEHQTRSGTKRIRVRRCNRTLRLSDTVVFQCQSEQHDDKHPHSHWVTVFTPDGTAKQAHITWTETGPTSFITLDRPLVVKSKPAP